jgi:hypothetical protein
MNLRTATPKRAKCKATTKHGDNAGKPCGRYPIPGGTVCVKHGGGAPQVRRKAEEQLRIARDELMEVLLSIARNSLHPDQFRALTWALDRAGFKLGVDLNATVEVKPYMAVLKGMFEEQAAIEPAKTSAIEAADFEEQSSDRLPAPQPRRNYEAKSAVIEGQLVSSDEALPAHLRTAQDKPTRSRLRTR